MVAAFLLAAYPLCAQIKTDGNTQTQVNINGNVTNVTTSTVSGNNAYNSFSAFTVKSGSTANLYLPNGTVNLLNLVNSQAANIEGILNGIEGGKIGGNIFFADPYGVIVGASGVVNVGSFTALTPTQDFMSQFFIAPGNPSPAATAALLNGTVPISPDGWISIKGTINAVAGIGLYGGTVSNSGVIQSGAVFSGSNPDFSDVVNTNGLRNASSIAVQNGNIVIQASGDFENSGTIATNGASNLNAGNVNVQAGQNVKLDSGSTVAANGEGSNSNGGNIQMVATQNAAANAPAIVEANGGGASGNGGSVEFSAKGTLTLDGGTFSAGATQGNAGKVSFDPTDLDLSGTITSGGADLNYSGDTITVQPGTTISSRNTASGANQLTGASTGNSGNITFTATPSTTPATETPTITVGDGSEILAQATNGYTAGDVTFTATQTDENAAASASAIINIGNATIEGGNVSFSTTATGTADSSKDGSTTN
ncbi:MAG: leukotoxin LktA family filamentous adhesin, partial [Limisphaerales bacterium]